MITTLADQNTIANQYLKEIRSADLQTDRLRFRRNMERLGELFAYEISKTLQYEAEDVDTPLGTATVSIVRDKIILVPILRAGLPMHQGFLHIYDEADTAFISAYRVHHKDGTFDIDIQYITCPPIDDAIVIMIDPMLATGASMEQSINKILEIGKPQKIHIVSAIAARSGLEYVRRLFPQASIWLGDVDEELTAKSYIVPGLGDAGDLCYGQKIQD